MKRTLSFGILSIFFMALGYAWFIWSHFINSPAGVSEQELIHEVIHGSSFYQVAHDLEKKGIVKNAQLFSLYGRLNGSANKIKKGEYAIRSNMSPKEVLVVIVSGKSILRPFTVAEGLNIFDISKLFEMAGLGKVEDFLSVVTDPKIVKKLV